MTLKFKIDSKKETANLPQLVELAGRNVLIGSLRKKFYSLSKEELYLEVKKLHKGNKKRFLKIKDYYKTFWKEINQDYIKEIEKIFNHKINENKTVYIVPSLYMNIANVLGRKDVFIVSEEKQQAPLDYLLLHELTHLHYQDALDRLNLHEAGRSPLMEGVDHLILFKSPIKNLFKKIKYKEIKFVRSNPQFMKELETLWENKKDFKSFIEKAIKVQRKTKGVIIC